MFCAFCGVLQCFPWLYKSWFARLQEFLWVAATCAWCCRQPGHLEEKGLDIAVFLHEQSIDFLLMCHALCSPSSCDIVYVQLIFSVADIFCNGVNRSQESVHSCGGCPAEACCNMKAHQLLRILINLHHPVQQPWSPVHQSCTYWTSRTLHCNLTERFHWLSASQKTEEGPLRSGSSGFVVINVFVGNFYVGV